jgi:hypothetical protein
LPRKTHLVGWVLDGFGIYVENDPNGKQLSSSSLDACHGRTGTVTWDGQPVRMYHYDATPDVRYLVSCYRGTPISSATGLDLRGGAGALGAPPPGGRP